MAREIVMPKLGLTMSEGTIVKWHVSEGDSVKAGDKIMSVETDKLTNDVEIDVDGVVRMVLYDNGDVVPVKQLVAVVAGEDEDISMYDDAKKSSEPKAKEDVKEVKAISASAPQPAAVVSQSGEMLATPYAKHLAKQMGVALNNVQATGYDGVIVARDIEAAKNNMPKMTGAAKNAAAIHGVDPSGIQSEGRIKKADIFARIGMQDDVIQPVEREKASNMRKIIAKNMLNNWNTSPMVTFDIDVNMDEVIRLRQSLNKEYASDGIKITYNHILVKALSKLLLTHKSLNSYFDGEEIEYHNYVNFGMAVATDTGLIVPNLKNSEKLSLPEIAVLLEDLIERTRNNTLQLSEMQGGTFTVTNLGMYGLKSFSPIINKPEVAIMGVNAIRDGIKLVDGEVVNTKVCTFSLTADHSVVDGRDAGAFLQDFKKHLENPYLML